MRKMFISIMSNWPLTMDQTQILSLRTLKKVNIPLHLLCQTARLIRVSRKTLATTLSTVCNWEHPTILDSTWTVKSMTILPKQRMNKKLLPRKQSWTRTSVKRWTLVSTANHMRHKYLDLMRLKIPFVVPWCHQPMSKSMEKILVKSLKNNWLPMGINGRVWAWPMVKLAFTTQKKPKLHLRKPKLNCKNKAFNSQFIWTTLSAKWTTAWSNKLAPSNNL